MFDQFRRILRHSLVYGLSSFFSRGIAFLMIPVYTRCLTTRDYAVVELVGVAAEIAGLVMGMGIRDAVLRFYFDGKTELERKRVISTGLIYTAALAGVITLGLLAFSEPLANWFFHRNGLGPMLRLALISNLLDMMVMICLTYFRALERSGLYTGILLGRLVIALTLNIVLVVGAKMGVMGILIGTLVSTSATAVVCLTWTLREVGFGFSDQQLKNLLAYGAPLVPASFAMFSLQYVDRFFLTRFSTMEEIGIYSLAYKFGMALSFFLTEPFFLAWSALMFPIALRDDAKEIYSRTLTYFMVVGWLFALGLALLGPGVIRLVATKPFYPAGGAIGILALGFLALAASYILNTGIYVEKKTGYRAISVVSAAVVNLVLNRMLIPKYGMIGASWATSISFIVLAGVAWAAAQRIYPIQYDFRRLTILLVVAGGLYSASALLPHDPLWLNLVLRLTLALVFPGVLYVIGFFSREELDVAWRSLRSIRERGEAIYRARAGV